MVKESTNVNDRNFNQYFLFLMLVPKPNVCWRIFQAKCSSTPWAIKDMPLCFRLQCFLSDCYTCCVNVNRNQYSQLAQRLDHVITAKFYLFELNTLRSEAKFWLKTCGNVKDFCRNTDKISEQELVKTNTRPLCESCKQPVRSNAPRKHSATIVSNYRQFCDVWRSNDVIMKLSK